VALSLGTLSNKSIHIINACGLLLYVVYYLRGLAVAATPTRTIVGTKPMTSLEHQIGNMIDERIARFEPASTMDESAVKKIVSPLFAKALDAALATIPPKEIHIKKGTTTTIIKGEHLHPAFETALITAGCGNHQILVGPAGSGKSTIARQVATALELDFYTQGPASSEYKYLGFVDAHGNLVETPLLKAYRDGGLFCPEEIDASSAVALVAGLNMVLANGHADFGNQIIKCHENFICIATANTWGLGASREYVGRNQLDAATLDRFDYIFVDYDEQLERAIAQNDSWTDFVQAARHAADTLKIRIVISPRASIKGAKLIHAGLPPKQVADMVVWRGLDTNTVKKIKTEIKTQNSEKTS
jgi:energy-coupling factor transporter ATP-binding protein EcfA2